jgi:hypothetical protein
LLLRVVVIHAILIVLLLIVLLFVDVGFSRSFSRVDWRRGFERSGIDG